MNSERIERIAVNRIQFEIFKSDLLKDEIPVNDKTPSWDGEIWVYRNEQLKKSQLAGKVPVQIKGKEVKNFSMVAKYPLNKDNLDNYFRNGGILFFLVEIVSASKTQIYYLDLLPIDLKKIIKDMGTKKTITQSLKRLDISSDSLEMLCRYFILHSEKQPLSLLIDKEFAFDSYKIKFFTPSQYDVQDFLLEHGTYAYRHIDDLGIDIPLYKIKIKNIEEETDLWIGIDSVKWYTEVKREISKEYVKLKFGSSLEVIINKTANGSMDRQQPLKINFNEKGTISDRIKDSKFMLQMIKENSLNINGSIIELNKFEDTSRLKNLPNYISNLEDIIETFRKLNILFDDDIDDFSGEELKTLNALVNIFYKGKQSNIETTPPDNPPFLQFKFGSYKLVLFTAKVQGKQKVFDLFNLADLQKHLKIRAIYNDQSDSVDHSPFLTFDATLLLEISNFDPKVVESSFKSLICENELSLTLTNDYFLQLLQYYDQHDHRKEILDLTLSIFDYLMAFSSGNINYYLNRMQIIKRMREFNKQEKENILIMKEQQSHTPDVLCAFYILLESKFEFEITFRKLSKEQREHFSNFPFYNLTKQW
ncbi:hypothetical protein JCM21714_1976 [Gracilibacillus boraciitolerans JCM 21714]|uniref:DUF4365 domain-containing protein n=1 Tax=Gracilibacillus boraciitolerans JCM 21714 TaxID=1298598 RepID=W4VIB8_9BACI|nr:hypothetical protein [Gracilibacillus boraciitolerans]GAE92947.1 hypothetical protein JCM21714_1976 [Gracilibacillus boraciitolerans JCM 21714]